MRLDVLPTFVAAGGAIDPAWHLDEANLLLITGTWNLESQVEMHDIGPRDDDGRLIIQGQGKGGMTFVDTLITLPRSGLARVRT